MSNVEAWRQGKVDASKLSKEVVEQAITEFDAIAVEVAKRVSSVLAMVDQPEFKDAKKALTGKVGEAFAATHMSSWFAANSELFPMQHRKSPPQAYVEGAE